MKCCNCESRILNQKYCVRDFKIKETRFQWWLRHVLGILTFNFWDRRKLFTLLPLCNECVNRFKKKNEEINVI